MRRSRTAPRRPMNSPAPKKSMFENINSMILAILGGVFALGIAIGVALGSNTTLSTDNVASTQVIDQSVPDAEFCQSYGASATVMDTRVFLTFKPFSVFVSQPLLQPGCVMRQNNMAILEQQKLVASQDLRDCRQRLNTFGFTGKLDSKPNISCIYQSESEKNRFLNQPGAGPLPSEADNF